jgi:hypothetical protein
MVAVAFVSLTILGPMMVSGTTEQFIAFVVYCIVALPIAIAIIYNDIKKLNER